MSVTKQFLSYLLVSFLCVTAYGQTYYDFDIKTGLLKKTAKHAVRKKDHYTAIAYYEKYLSFKKSDKKSMLELAHQYRLTRNYVKATQKYQYAYEMDPDKNLIAQYYKAKMLMSTTYYAEAISEFTSFRKSYRGRKNESIYRRLSKTHIAGCKQAIADSLAIEGLYTKHLENGINMAYNEISPFPISHNQFIYSSIPSDTVIHYKDSAAADSSLQKMVLFSAKQDGKTWTFNETWKDIPFESEFHNGNAVYDDEMKTVYFTKCKENWKYEMICQIYFSTFENDVWTIPEPIEEINHGKYNTTQPCLAIDAKSKRTMLYFVSNRPHGKGGLDIWYSIRKKGVFQEPKNCGSRINTNADEMTPYFDIESNSMYFSSDGHPGYGALDIFRSFGQKSKWIKTPEHLAQPINSPTDDLYFINGSDPKWGFFTSNREGGIALKHPTCCDDIYLFEYDQFRRFNYKAQVFSEDDNVKISQGDVEVYMREKESGDTTYIKTVEIDENGKLSINVERGLKYTIILNSKDHFRLALDIPGDSEDIEFRKTDTIYLQKITKEAIVLKNIYYDFDDWHLTARAKIAIDSFLLQVLNLNPSIKVEISAHTDAKGSGIYNIKLSQKRAESVVDYLKRKGISRSRMIAKGYGKTKPIAPNTHADGSDNPEGRQLNRRTEFRVIGYK